MLRMLAGLQEKGTEYNAGWGQTLHSGLQIGLGAAMLAVGYIHMGEEHCRLAWSVMLESPVF